MSNFAKYENLQALFTAIGKKKLSVSDTMPTAGAAYEDICILYIGPTDANYTKGYVYECEEVIPATDPKTYEWNAKINVDVDLSKYKTIFPGTKDEWDALTQTQQDQYDYCFFDDDESDVYAVTDSITEGDMHPVTSNAVFELSDSLDTQLEANANAITDIANVYGAKNLLNHDIESGEVGGLTFTVNADRSITVNGTASANVVFTIWNAHNLDSSKRYTLSGCAPGGADNKYLLTYTDGGYNHYDDIGSGVTFTPFTTGADKILFEIFSDQTFTNVTFKPMLRLASIKDGTYEPYAMSNKELTTYAKTIESQAIANKDVIVDIVNVYGSKNLLPIGSTGVKGTSTTWETCFKENTDGTFTIKGSSTGRVSVSRKAILPAGQYYMNGCPSGGGNSTYRLMFLTYDSGSEAVVYEDRGNAPSIVTLDTETTVYARCDVYANASGVTGKVFKPMIRKASIVNSEYVPYSKTNKQLTDDSVDWDNLSEFGAVNLLDNVLKTSTKNGLTATVNSDKSVTVTADSYPFTVTTDTYFALQTVTPTGVHKLRGCPATGDSKIYIYVRNNSGGYIYDYGNGGIGSFGGTGCNICFMSGAIVTEDLTFYPMITDPLYNGPYVPYAKTNKQLTEDVSTIDITSGISTTVGTLSVTKGYRVGKIVFIEGNITLTSDIAAWGKVLSVDIGEKFANQYIFAVGYDYNNSIFVPMQSGYDAGNLKLETIKALASGVLLKFALNAVLE